jgi:LuxR family maltose regulon positive regulatory protein
VVKSSLHLWALGGIHVSNNRGSGDATCNGCATSSPDRVVTTRQVGSDSTAGGTERRILGDGESDPNGHLRINLFGNFRVSCMGLRVDEALGIKSRALLKILASNRAVLLPKDALMELVWPMHDASTVATSLKVAAHKLRQALSSGDPARETDEWIIAKRGSYRLSPNAEIWIDVEAFEAHCARGRQLLRQGAQSAARLEFDQAEQLYSGDYLAEDIYDDWTVIRREELRDMYLETLDVLVDLCMTERMHRDVIRYCHKIVSADPCREDAYRKLMNSHAALNQIGRAGSWYAICRVILQREIGAQPSHETTRTFEALFAGPGAQVRARPA